MFNSALSGDKAAQSYLSYLWAEAGKQSLHNARGAFEKISDVSSTATLVFFAVGLPEAAAVTGAIGRIANGAIALDDYLSGNTVRAAIGAGAIFVGAFVSSKVSRGLGQITEKGLAIRVGKNGLYYSLGRRGAMQTWETTQALIRADIAASKFGDLAPEVVDQLINKAKDAYDALQN